LLGAGLVYMSGLQALVELALIQRRRDAAAGLNTAGFISGYRGSPLGGYDQALWAARDALAAAGVTFQPGLNEELAATAVWGSQQVGLFPGARYDGVFGLWYGKGPGADRSMDVFKHANAAGSAPFGGVVAIVGDDHGARSSTLPHQSDHDFAAAVMPVLNPSTVQELLDFGVHAIAMSRFSGCWVAMKAVSDTVETSTAIDLDPFRVETVAPDFPMPPDGLHIRWPDTPMAQELRLQGHKVYAAMAYAHANGVNRVIMDSPRARFGIMATGKSYLDVLQALDSFGIDEAAAAEIGLRVMKVGMPWPLDAVGVRAFAEGLEEILIVEEKRQLIEYQLKEQLYNWRADVRPVVVGKYGDEGEWGDDRARRWLLPAAGELSPAMVARAIAVRIARFHTSERIAARLAFLEAKEAALAAPHGGLTRTPYYCSGCPHNTSTRVPDGSRALAGIGCHYMALWIDPEHTQTFSQMGGEGVAWVGQAPFTDTAHVFVNLGDGTYQHSGVLALRQAVAAGVRVTYKILFNDAVAMTGGQPVEGGLTVPQLVDQVAAEGVGRIVVVTDEPEKYRGVPLHTGVPVRHRRELDALQRELRDYEGVSVIVYDQVCAAEKRRRRKRGTFPDPPRRVVINDRVCENCGDCSNKSDCVSVVSVETEFGRKREIDQSSCNKDYSCLEGFCPSFVTVEGGGLRKGHRLEPVGGLGAAGGSASTGALDVAEAPAPARADLVEPMIGELPEPRPAPLTGVCSVLVAGVGGTGIVTIAALLGAAATVEGKAASALDMAGLAQKGGPVWSHVRFAPTADELHGSRIATGDADVVIGCDLVVAASDESLSKMHDGQTRAAVNSAFSITGDFVRAFAAQARAGDAIGVRDPVFPLSEMEEQIAQACGPGRAEFIDATRLATALMGDSIATNLFMVGYAYQKGLLPLQAASILTAIELNGVAVDMNRRSFAWGRLAAHDLAAVEKVAVAPKLDSRKVSATLEETIARRVEDLADYRDRRYAQRYAALVEQVRAAEAARTPGLAGLTRAVALNLYKLMAYKDEYEVARLHVRPDFLARIEAMFEGDYRIVFHLAPPLWAKPDPVTGEPRKRAFGPWILPLFRLLAGARRLRGTPLDPFGWTAERRADRKAIADYEALIEELLAVLGTDNHALVVELASLPDLVRGYGPVRRRFAAAAKREEARLLHRLHGDPPTPDVPPVRRTRGVVVTAG
jgi:indolepyruvate ferredoxin oxidoreductase